MSDNAKAKEPIKVEARGKYAGTKIHLDGPTTQRLLDLRTKLKASSTGNFNEVAGEACAMIKELGKPVAQLFKQNPDLLQDKTEEQVQAALTREAVSAKKKLDALGLGEDWTKVKVTVEK